MYAGLPIADIAFNLHGLDIKKGPLGVSAAAIPSADPPKVGTPGLGPFDRTLAWTHPISR